MNVAFVKCEFYGCKNITTGSYKDLYGAFCFEHTGKNKAPMGIPENKQKLSPISPRRISLQRRETDPISEPVFENYEYKVSKVASPKLSIPSPSRRFSLIQKMECCICKDKYDENKVMNCGHMICPQCLEGRIRSPYCDFCGEPLEGPFVTEEIYQNIMDKYKQDQERNVEEDEEEGNEEEANEEEEENEYEAEYEEFLGENEEEQEEDFENEIERENEEDY